MQPERMQHRTRPLHHTQHEDGEHKPEPEGDDDHDDLHAAGHTKGVGERHVPEHDGELLVGEREGPETEVGGGVGDAVEAEFDGIYELLLG
jgi:hypothetical protein